jgi:hypothetical protein
MYLSEYQIYLDNPTLGMHMAAPLNNDLVFNYVEKNKKENKRIELDTTLIFTGGDYDYIQQALALSACAEIEVIIKYRFQEIWRGYINPKKGSYDPDTCRVEIKPTPKDTFDCLDRIIDREKNIIFESIATQTAYLGFPEATLNIQQCNLGTFNNVAIIGGSLIFNVNNLPDFSVCNLGSDATWALYRQRVEIRDVFPDYTFQVNIQNEYVREEVIINCNGNVPSAPDGFTLIENNCVTQGTAKFGRKPDTYIVSTEGELIGSNEVNPAQPLPTDKVLRIIQYGVFGYTEEGQPIIYNRCRKVNDVLNNLVGDCATIVSDFFGINGDNTAPDNSVYQKAAIETRNLLIWQKSDFKRPTAFQGATNGNITLAQLLEMLAMFNISWQTTNGVLRIEHISYYDKGQGQDLTIEQPTRVGYRNSYSYDQGELVRYEKFSWQDPSQDLDFRGRDIEYPNECAEGVKNYSFGRLSTSMPELISNPSNFSDDGFVIGATYEFNGKYGIISDVGLISSVKKVNAPLSLANLHFNYWRHDRLYPTGILNAINTTFVTAKKTKRQVAISIPILPDAFFSYDWEKLVKTGLGWGLPTNISYTASGCLATINVLHD